jgi:hypothetical protein
VPTTRAKPTTVKISLGRNRKLRLARPWGSASASGGDLRLARPQGSASTLASGKSHILARPWASAPASASEEPPLRPTSGSDQPRYKGSIITLLLASSGYEGTRPASHPAYPGDRRWWFPACNHDVGGSQAPYGSKETSAGSIQHRQLYCYRAQGTSPTATILPLQDSRRPLDGHVVIYTGLRALPCQPH